jgi:glycosyltransferase involved in cell wall biosynthesis
MISIIIPTFNDSQYLERAIKSCMNQDINTEIVVIDDCSNETHKGNINSLKEKYTFKLITNQINYGLAGSRNKGIEESKYNVIIPLDCDDVMYGNCLYKMYSEILNGNDIVYGIISDGTEDKYVIAKPVDNITLESFLGENPLFCTSMFTKEIWKRAGGYPMFPFSVYEDMSFWCKCQSVGAKFKYINEMVYHHTNTGNSMLTELHSKTNEYKELARKGLDYATNKNCFRFL